MVLSRKLKQLREELGLTQAQLGQVMGVTDAFISQTEKGRRMPGRNHCRNLADHVAYRDSRIDADALYDHLQVLQLRQISPDLYALLRRHFSGRQPHADSHPVLPCLGKNGFCLLDDLFCDDRGGER